MVHGLGSSAQTCWQVLEALAQGGWSATAVDLRGHGVAPRASSYTIAEFATDLVAVTPLHRSPTWDAVIGHSLGAASAVVASATHPTWTKALVLLDPALSLDDTTRMMVLDNQRLGHLQHDHGDVAELNPSWHPLDVELKVHAHRAASLFALERAVLDNDPWDVSEHVTRLTVPTHILGADEAHGALFPSEDAAQAQAQNPLVSYEMITGAGHSLHRDRPQETIGAITAFLHSSVS